MNRQRRRTGRWVLLALTAITVLAVLSAWLTAPRIGGRMDPDATSPLGGHALIALLRERGVEVVVAASVPDVERAARPDSLLLVAETENTRGAELLGRLAAVPGDRLVVEPTAKSRQALAPGIRISTGGRPAVQPGCDLREAQRAGTVVFADASTYEQSGDVPVIRCYGGALVRYTADGRTITVVGSAGFMTNGGLPREGDAALAMNLAGSRDRLIWYAPQQLQGDTAADKTIGELIPRQVFWVVLQLGVVVALLALWQGRRLGPLVAERLPVVVRASETVEGRARMYRSLRARGQAAAALRTAALHRLRPRLGLDAGASEVSVTAALAWRCGMEQHAVGGVLFGPPPESDNELLELARSLDDIERQVSHS
ncbi:DUF4350 domain-containing protein [Mycolicibacterium sp.]|uniref:DUF4350 domain-containing protein n=1 Tax=Mycolicibacterium sp. TaxID=2320850 RepID=UPI0028A6E7EB|nr:DUF4350 domain-containing protein [Mycolicibacterium sp.]